MVDSDTNCGPVVLIIRDGWGRNPHPEHDAFNAVHQARTPVADRLAEEWPSTLIRTCGEDVGLPAGTMGNSEVGHQNIGAGRVVPQEVMRITESIRAGSFFENPSLNGAFDHVAGTGGNVHLLGLVSDGQVHSDIEHLEALIEMASRRGLEPGRLLIHAITDGRDTPPRSGLGFVRRVEACVRKAGVGRIASVAGRFYAMDRDHRWERVAVAWTCFTGREVQDVTTDVSVVMAGSAETAIQGYYDHPTGDSRQGDEFIVPTQLTDPATGRVLPRIGDGDAVIFFNFRGDRPREITKAFVLDDAAWAAVKNGGFQRGERMNDLYFCVMTRYESNLPVTAVAFDRPSRMPDILGEVVSAAGRTQLRCAETEKYPHVTFFFNDYREEPFPGEQRQLVPSPQDVKTYDQKPEMSAAGVGEAVLARLAARDCESLIVVNFANPDMVGHTGKLEAVVKAVETTDDWVGRIVDAVLSRGGAAIVTADHGNAEQLWDTVNDCPHTAHTTYDVPLFIVSETCRGQELRDGGRLADIAPTVLALMGLEQPAAMTGQSLVTVSGCHASP